MLILFLVCWLSALPEPWTRYILLWHVSCVRELLELTPTMLPPVQLPLQPH